MVKSSEFCALSIDQSTEEFLVWHQANWNFPDEFHHHQMGQLIYVEKGFQYIETTDKKYIIPHYHCAWIPTNELHKTTSSFSNVHLRTLYFRSPPDQDFFKEVHIFLAPTVLREMILYSERYSQQQKIDRIGQSFLTTILANLKEMCQEAHSFSFPIPKSAELHQLINHLHTHFQEPLKMNEVALNFGFSTRTLERRFDQEIGISPAHYFKMIRLLKAIELLTQGNLNISEIAYQVGYTNATSFNKTFKKYFKQSPTSYLKQLQ